VPIDPPAHLLDLTGYMTGFTRYKDNAKQAALSLAALTPGPSNASLPFKLAAAEGKYRNPGYGSDIALCAPSTASPNCKAVLARLNSTFPAEIARADLIWAWDRITADYVSLTHFDGPLFNVTGWVGMVRSPAHLTEPTC
jgi:hypothetical protein